MTPTLSLTVLADNTTTTDRLLRAEPGLSFLLETAEKKILFDTGLSGLFLDNAEQMGIGLQDPDFLVLSHGHRDHTGGLSMLVSHPAGCSAGGRARRMPDLIAHPRCFWPKEKEPGTFNGSPMSENEVRQHFRLTLSADPVRITDRLFFLGEIPRKFAFEETEAGKRKIHRPDGRAEPDLLLDDSALAFCSDEGLVIITGCSHAGICNITDHAREVCGERRIIDIIGGLHLLTPDLHRWKMTGEYLRDLQLPSLHACHCTSLAAKIYLAGYAPVQEAGVGLTLEWPVAGRSGEGKSSLPPGRG
jgi:7,8-dihydropterin-6-yl-methyl-4-(beta-D-ribofuranosyl)aminobenzene 5'-phosphate synthase